MNPRRAGRPDRVLVSCEHGGHEVPAAWAGLFGDHAELLRTHRGWDAGAIDVARDLAAALDAPLFVATTTRLLIDLNRSIGHHQLHSELTRALPRHARRAIAAEHYRPHRGAIEAAVAAAIDGGARVLHIASHSFTPELNGVLRQADIAWLYAPRRAGERAFAACWRAALQARRPDLRLRRNYPYRGTGDGLTALLRTRHADDRYVGVELEVNQRFVLAGGDAWSALRRALVESLQAALAA